MPHDTDEHRYLPYETYLAVIRNAVGTRMFRNLYVEREGEVTDVIRDGELACAWFVSSVLTLFQLIDGPHTTVVRTIEEMEKVGWEKTAKPTEGCVLVWEEWTFSDGEKHKHIGFFVGDQLAISNSAQEGLPVEHHYTYEDMRRIEAMYTHQQFMSVE